VPVGDQAGRMLIVDDDADHRAFLHGTLRRSSAQVQVFEAETIDEGRALLSSGDFDCALVDLQLPDGDGRDLIASAGTTPVVIVTSADHRAQCTEALAMGAQDFLVREDLTDDSLQRVLERSRDRKRDAFTRIRAEHEHRLATLGRLARSVGHEINNPASVVSLGLDSIALRLRRMPDQTPYREEAMDTIADCREAMNRIVSVVRHIVTVAAPAADSASVSVFDLGSVVDSVCALADPSDGIELRRTGQSPGMVRGQAAEIIQALLAVIDNAVRVSPGDAVVQVETGKDSDGLFIRVADGGPGIPAEHVDRVFEPFFSTGDDGARSGLGLTVARDVFERHGGGVSVAANGPAGTTIELRLPA